MLQKMEQSFRSFLSSPSGIGGRMFKSCLSLSSKGYGLGVSLRNLAYDSGIFPVHASKIPCVISIGNIQAGGTGKTPFTLMLAQTLSRNLRLAILSRGYRSIASHAPKPVLINDAYGPLFSPAYCGDEPYLLSQRLVNTPVIVSKNRIAAAQLAETWGVDVLLLDDGFQHRSLKRDYDVVLVDASLADEAMHLLPRGLLREKPKTLSRAHLVVVTNAQNNSQVESIRAQLAAWTDVPIISADKIVAEVCGKQGVIRSSLAAQKAALFCGIANPASFVQTVEQLSMPVVSQYSFADHAAIDRRFLSQWAVQARDKGADCLICTEKDAIKVIPWADKLCLPLYWLKLDIRISSGNDIWDKWLQEIIRKAS